MIGTYTRDVSPSSICRNRTHNYHSPADYGVAQAAKAMGMEDDYALLMNRSMNYEKLWPGNAEKYNPGFFQAPRKPLDHLYVLALTVRAVC